MTADDEADLALAAAGVDLTTGEVHEHTGAGCDRCGAYEAQVAGLLKDVKGLERDQRAKNRQIDTLRAEINEQREQAPEMAIARMVFHRWVERTDRNPKRTKLGEKRSKAIIARLRDGYDVEDLLSAVDALALAPTTSSSETQRLALLAVMHEAMTKVDPGVAADLRHLYAERMRNVVVYDDLELAFRDEVKLERFRGVGERLKPPAPPV